MQFSKKLIEEILMFEYVEEDFNNSASSSLPVTNTMSKKLKRFIMENRIEEPIIHIVSKAVALYIEVGLKNHNNNDVLYYFFHDILIVDKTCNRGWSIDAENLYNKFIEYIKVHFENIEMNFDYEDFILYILNADKTIKKTKQKEKDILLHIRYRI